MTHEPYAWTKEEAQIIKACWATDAGALALQLVVERLGRLHGGTLSSDALQMAHSEGRRSLAIDLMDAINTPLDRLVKEEPLEHGHPPITATERAAQAAAGQHTTRKR